MNKKKKKLLIKIFSVFFSFVIWFYVLSSTSVIINKDVKVSYIVPDGYSLASDVPDTIKYKIKGPRAIMNEIISRDENIEIDLRKTFNPNSRRYTLSYLNYQKNFPFSLKVSEVTPKSIQIYLVRSSVKKVPIKITSILSVAEGLKITKIKPLDTYVNITGAKEILEDIEQIESEPIDLSAIEKSRVFTVKLESPDVRVKIGQHRVNVNVDVAPNTKKVLLKSVPIKFVSTKAILSSSFKSVDLELEVLEGTDLVKLQQLITISANAQDSSRDLLTVDLNIDLPEEVKLIRSSVSKVLIRTGKEI